MMADHFLDDEVEEFLRKIGVEMGSIGELTQARDLLRFARRIGRRQPVRGLELTHRLRAFEPFRQQVNERCVDIVDALAKALKFGLYGSHGRPLFLVRL